MAFDKIYQVYKKNFESLHELNVFLTQFPKGELEPIEIEENKTVSVWFKTSRPFSIEEINTYELSGGREDS